MTATNICYNFVGFRCSPPLMSNAESAGPHRYISYHATTYLIFILVH